MGGCWSFVPGGAVMAINHDQPVIGVFGSGISDPRERAAVVVLAEAIHRAGAVLLSGAEPPEGGFPDTPKPKRYTVDDFLNRRARITVTAKDRPALERLCKAHGIEDFDLELCVAERNGFTRPFCCSNWGRKTALFTDWIGIELPVIPFRDLTGVEKYFKEGK